MRKLMLIKETTQYQRAHFQLSSNLYLSLLKAYPIQWVCIFLLKIGLMAILLLNPIIVSNIVTLFDAPEIDMIAFAVTIGIFLTWIISIYAQMSILNFYQKKVHAQVQAALSAILYSKLFTAPLPLPPQAEIINLFQIDIPQIILLFDCGVSLFLTPFQICGAILVYFSTIGMAASIGVTGMLVQVAISLLYGSVYSMLQKNIMNSRDKRVSGIDELLRGILTIKQNCYYKFFFNRIQEKRQNEMKDISTQQQLYFIVQALFSVIPVCVMYFTIQLFDIFTLKSVLLVTQNYAQLIQAVNYIPYNLGQVFVAITSGKRFMEFVGQSDVEQYTEISPYEIVIRDGNFKWYQLEEKAAFELRNINVTFRKGSFVVIVGGNGSGKTSLLYAILGELQKISGQVLFMEGNLSMASQEPFVKQGTIMENIIGDLPFDMTRYLRTLEAAQLIQDVLRMPAGHNTEVGENGQSLSGGQRKRLNIARALYRKCDILLLDCPFASLDHKTAEKMMNSLQQINQQEKQTIIITCNDLLNVKKCDQIVCLDNGQIVYDGDLANYQKSSMKDIDSLDFSDDQPILQLGHDIYQQIDLKPVIDKRMEDRQIGTLDISVFRYLYFLFGKYKTLIFIVVFCLFGMGVSMIYQLQLKSITEVSDSENSTDEEKLDAIQKFLIVYPTCQVLIAISALINGIFLTRKGVTASVKLHNNIVNNLLKASVTDFYNVTQGSIIKNRLTNDIFQFDTNTPQQISSLFSNTFNLIALSLACIYLSSALSYPILLIYLVLQTHYVKKYIMINLEVSRLQAISKSPVLNHVSETHSGIAFYRHCNSNNHFDELFNIYTRNSLCQAALYAWFLQITCMMMLIMYVCIIFVNYLYKINHKEAATISVYLSIAVGEMFTGFAIQFQNFYSNNVYLERCLQLVNNIPKEDFSNQQYSEFEIPQYQQNSQENMSEIEMMTINSQPEEMQPEFVLEVINLSLKYQNSLILSNVSFKLAKGQKIAIIGRTGAGKTSLMHCITRLVEPYSGQLKVLGQENLSINRVRQLFSVVSQDPFVFEGTVQQNIDPNSSYSQLEITQQFNRYGLMDVDLLQQLNFYIEPHGQNLSLGQKQLLVMCRILLQQRKIVILDECTGNLDSEYSKLINLTLDLYMKDKSVIAITHKLDLLDMFEYVLIVDKGRIIEEGQRSVILSKYI